MAFMDFHLSFFQFNFLRVRLSASIPALLGTDCVLAVVHQAFELSLWVCKLLIFRGILADSLNSDLQILQKMVLGNLDNPPSKNYEILRYSLTNGGLHFLKFLGVDPLWNSDILPTRILRYSLTNRNWFPPILRSSIPCI